jgi:hypothetical protein
MRMLIHTTGQLLFITFFRMLMRLILLQTAYQHLCVTAIRMRMLGKAAVGVTFHGERWHDQSIGCTEDDNTGKR